MRQPDEQYGLNKNSAQRVDTEYSIQTYMNAPEKSWFSVHAQNPLQRRAKKSGGIFNLFSPCLCWTYTHRAKISSYL
jgi:hypothetical protein